MTRSHPEQALECPRCSSTNTKFCYYNNYSLSQPRYFCKGCRRYWTHGGSLRNVPVGGGCRKNKRSSNSSSSSSTSSSSSKKPQDQDLTITHSTSLLPILIPPPLPYRPTDDLTFTTRSPSFAFGSNAAATDTMQQPSAAPSATANGFLDILRSGFADIQSPRTGLGNLYFGMTTGVNEGGGLLSFEGAGLASTATESTTSCHGLSCRALDGVLDHNKVVPGLPWQEANMDLGRDSWTGGSVGSSSFQGLINSSML
ncbi:hypothetical protein Cni_G13534 [Canna indica]|uniref:Dof zinc finger protein n=1 Tax=Canna indica TaxID=4628 RepID=A0AAQ3KAE7_9LILI|nr:hypothetical protein Cni_G13534 [Canna indica]